LSALRSKAAASFVALSVFACAARVHAGGPLPPNGAPIQTSQYSIDLFSGPIFAGSRITGLAGAYVAISEDVDGDQQNPAAPGVRPFFSYNNFDYWIGFGLTFPATLQNTDFFNSGSTTHIANSPDSFVFLTPALNLQWGDFGIGVNIELQHYALSEPTTMGERFASISATIPTTHFQVARGFEHNQLVIGAGIRLASMSVRPAEQTRAVFTSSGTGVELGGVFKPENVPLRLGVAFRTAIVTEATYRDSLLPDQNGDLVVTASNGTPVYLPKSVALPWDFNFGFTVQFGPRPLNPPWRTTSELIERRTLEYRIRELDRQVARRRALAEAKSKEEDLEIRRQYDAEELADQKALDSELDQARLIVEASLTAMNRFYVQVSGAMLVSGPVDQAVGVESLVSQTVNRSGQRTVGSPRIGVESGGFLPWLRVRGGSYLEPTRFDGSTARVHATAGFDIKLVKWNVFGAWPDDYLWRLGVGGDVSRQYYTWGFTIAGWYPRHADATELLPAGQSPSSLLK